MSSPPEKPEDEQTRRRREAFEAAAAATGDTHDMLWHSLFALQQAAGSKNWEALRRHIDEDFTEIPLHAFSLAAFGQAAAAGQRDIVEAMTERGFRLPAGDAEDALAWLATRHAATALPVVELLLGQKFADPGPAILAVAAEGVPAALGVFRRAGCDIHAGDSFSAAFHGGNTAMMEFLAADGAELHGPATVKGLHGGLEAWQQAHNGSVVSFDTAGTMSACRKLLAADREKWRKLYAASAPDHPSLDDFRKAAAGDITLMQAAARAGHFSDVIAAAAADSQQPLTAAEMLHCGKHGANLLSILAAQGEAAQAFDARAWHRNPEGVEPLRAALAEMGAGDVFDPAGFAADVQRCRLREQERVRPAPRLRR